MRTNSAKLYLGVISACAFLALGSGAFAQAPAPKGPVAQSIEARLEAGAKKIQAACTNDVKTHCSGVSPGNGRIMLCVMAHEDKISTGCDFALYEAGRNLQRAVNRIADVADACWEDIEKRCANVPEGGGRVAGCLASNKASLTRTCRTMIEKISVK